MRIAVIGGGVAGLTAAVHLTKRKHEVVLFERSSKLGGRIASMNFEGRKVDIGQHLMLGCYFNTLELIKIIGSSGSLQEIKTPKIPFINRQSEIHYLDLSSKVFFPLNLVLGLLKFDLIEKKSVYQSIKMLLKNKMADINPLRTVKEHLSESKIPLDVQEIFWKQLCESIMNASMSDASAKVFFTAIEQAFSSRNSSNFILPRTTLEDLIVLPSEKFISENGGTIVKSSQVESIKETSGSLVLSARGKDYKRFDKVIITTAPNHFSKLLPGFENLPTNFISNPILNVHLKIENVELKEKFYSFIDSDIHWLFNHGNIITLTASNPVNYLKLDKDELRKKVIKELINYFPEISVGKIKKIKTVLYHNSTWNYNFRKFEKIKINLSKNIILAGDWSYPELPSTIESATLSGKIASNQCCKLSLI